MVYNPLFNFRHLLFWGLVEVRDTNVNLYLKSNQNHKVRSISKVYKRSQKLNEKPS